MNRWDSIQTRLIVAFLAVVFLSLSGLSVMQVISGTRSTQTEINRQLTTIVSFKARIIREWANTLKSELGNILVGRITVDEFLEVLSSEETLTQGHLARLRLKLQTAVADSRYYGELFVLDPHGSVVLASAIEMEGRSFAGENFFETALSVPVIGRPVFIDEVQGTALYVSYPILSPRGERLGVLVGRARYDPLDQIFTDTTGLREKAETFLLDNSGVPMAGSNPALLGKRLTGLSESLTGTRTTSAVVYRYTNPAGVPVTAAYQRVSDLQGILLVEQENREVARTWVATLAVNLSVALASLIIALYIGLHSVRSIAGPLTDLVEISARITSAAGQAATEIAPSTPLEPLGPDGGPLQSEADDLEDRARSWQDEIGVLAQAFNRMTRQLSGLIGSLEARVEERTQAVERHARYLEASADVSRAAASILDPERLIADTVELIRDRFELYYVGLFLIDPNAEWAVLRSGTGEAGQAMLRRGHRLRLEPTSMIGWCISNDEARIAQVASSDEVRVVNPELPETRSEAALPLHARGQVIGALTVQSSQPNAFNPAALQVLQTMADQLGIAIENAQLFTRSREALEAERRAYALSSRAEWEGWRAGAASDYPSGSLSLRSEAGGEVEPLDRWTAEMEQAYAADQTVQTSERLAIPIRVRGHVIGAVSAQNPCSEGSASRHGWSKDEVSFLEGIAEQLGVALDTARLYAETRKRAEQERLVDDLTGRMRATLDIQTVLETAARELRDALGLAEVEVRLGQPGDSGVKLA